jgi:hypothetical protein
MERRTPRLAHGRRGVCDAPCPGVGYATAYCLHDRILHPHPLLHPAAGIPARPPPSASGPPVPSRCASWGRSHGRRSWPGTRLPRATRRAQLRPRSAGSGRRAVRDRHGRRSARPCGGGLVVGAAWNTLQRRIASPMVVLNAGSALQGGPSTHGWCGASTREHRDATPSGPSVSFAPEMCQGVPFAKRQTERREGRKGELQGRRRLR